MGARRKENEHEKSNEKGSWGGTAVILSLAMVLSVFIGTGFDVEAADGLDYKEFAPPATYAELKDMCLDVKDLTVSEALEMDNAGNYPVGVTVVCDTSDVLAAGLKVVYNINGSADSLNVSDQRGYENLKKQYPPSKTEWYIAKQRGNQPVSGRFMKITDAASIENMEALYSPDAPYRLLVDRSTLSDYPSDAIFVLAFWKEQVIYMQQNQEGIQKSFDEMKTYLTQGLDVGTPIYVWVSDEPAASETTSQGDNEASAPHTHSYSWVTVQEVNAEQDGIEEYRCSCGDVQERCVIPRYMAIVKGLYGAVKDAPQNGTATFDTGSAFTMTDYVIRKLAERTDVTTVVTFKYQNQSYKMTIPAGVDYTELLSDEDYFYGYFYFADAIGATIEAI